MTRFGLTHQQLSNLLATGGEFRREEFRREKKATDPVHNTIQYNHSYFNTRVIIKRCRLWGLEKSFLHTFRVRYQVVL